MVSPRPRIPVERINLKAFWANVDIGEPDECWRWKRGPRGAYGSFRVGYSQWPAHRISWVIHNGQVPPGLHVLHSCDHPECCNPNHLRAGTAADNSRDRWGTLQKETTCSVPGCERPSASLWMCTAHYMRQKRGIDLTKPIVTPPAPITDHGTRAVYCKGCRCSDCRAANSAYHRSYQAQKLLDSL